MSTTAEKQPFLSDIKTLRERARREIEKGAITTAYEANPQQVIELLQAALATEIVCVLRYTMHAITATGISSKAVAEEFAEHADEERSHMELIAKRIDQLGGTPNFNPEGLASRSASQYSEGGNLVGMLKENLIAERIAVEHYEEMIRFFEHVGDIETARLFREEILPNEIEHATEMRDLLVDHEGQPFIQQN